MTRSLISHFSTLKCLYSSFHSNREICRTVIFPMKSNMSQLKFPSRTAHTAVSKNLSNCGCITRTWMGNQKPLYFPSAYITHYVSTTPENETPKPEPKPSMYQRFKAMYRDYWYVLVPVHLVTSAAWYGGFYYIASSGVDIVALMESLNVTEKIINPLRNGHTTTGYLAIAYALYKIATPLRYTVTLGGTTISINYLKRWGYIKPVPSKEKLKEIYDDKKLIFKEKGQSLKDNMMQSWKTTANN